MEITTNLQGPYVIVRWASCILFCVLSYKDRAFWSSHFTKQIAGSLKMQNLRSTILSYLRIGIPVKGRFVPQGLNGMIGHLQLLRACSTDASINQEQIVDRVIRLVKKFDKIDSDKVTEKADFQKDLSLDSLDRVELVMAFEEEFSVEIPDAEADKLKSCADVAKYVISRTSEKVSETS
ncbi:mitochondrial acyl carrier protein 3 [Perilla frutescens var. hirtella]|nr:mitochondrial acyl carrier protein 3 [Perilla frutescens var. frutescens]KAH6775897.1 mitochondrial acyl carrier protein 3 [Perilla frutescens var. hirtella]